MTVEELVARFPEIPRDLRGEALVARLAEECDELLRLARNPSPCAAEHDAGNHYYLKLIGPMSVYGYGLSTREQVLGEIGALLDRQAADPEGFAAGLLPDPSP